MMFWVAVIGAACGTTVVVVALVSVMASWRLRKPYHSAAKASMAIVAPGLLLNAYYVWRLWP